MNKVLKSIITFLTVLIVTIIVLYLALKDNYEEILKQILTINKGFLLFAFLLIISYWLLKAVVMQKTVLKFKKDYTFKEAIRLILETNFFHAVTPFSSGGQPYEIFSLKRSKLKISEATNVSIQNFIVYQIALVLLGMIAVICNYFLHIFPSNSFLKYLVTLGFLCNLFVIVILFIISFSKNLNKKIISFIIKLLNKLKVVKNKEKTIEKFEKYISDFNNGAKILIQDKKNFIEMILYNFLALLAFYLIPLVLLYGTGDYTSINAFTTIITSAYVMMVGSFVPIPGGSGGLEYAFIVFYSTFITGPVLNAIMLLWRAITYYFGMIVGAITLLIKRKER